MLLDQRTRKLDYADLYARLLTEWLADTSAATTPPPEAATGGTGETGSQEEPFELVAQTKLQQLREMFESYVFAPLETDAAAITSYLDGLFKGRSFPTFHWLGAMLLTTYSPLTNTYAT